MLRTLCPRPVLAACALWALLASRAVCAQEPQARPDTGAAGRPRILLPLALDARNQIEAADRLAAKEQWEQALPILQTLLDAAGGRDAAGGPDSDAGRMTWDGEAYVPVADVVNRRLAALPKDARRAYALLYDARARQLYERGLARRSAPDLREAARRYLNTTYGAPAVSGLACLLMDEGEFGAALLALETADVLSPPADVAGPIAARKLICLAGLDDRARAEELVQALSRRGVSRIIAAGKEQGLADLMETAFAQLAPTVAPTVAPTAPPQGSLQALAPRGEWPSLGGNPAGNAPPHAYSPARLFPLFVDLRWRRPAQAAWPFVASVRPIAGRDAVFVQRDGAVLAVDRKTRRTLWADSPPEVRPGRLESLVETLDPDDEPLLNALPVGNVHRWRTFDNHGLATLSIDGARLFAVRMDPLKLGFPEQPWLAQPEDFVLANELQCLDAASGRLLWNAGGDAPSSPAALRRCWFFTAPTVSDGRAYVLAARNGELHALCLEAETGELLWDTPIGPFESRQEAQRYAMELFVADTGPPAVAQGIAVFPTGQGLAYACNAYDGSILWISPYPRASVWIDRLGTTMNVPAGPWLPAQPLVGDGVCLVAPMDSRCLVAFSLRTGAVAWQQEFPRGMAVLGARDGRAYVQHMGASCLDLRTGERLWDAALNAEPVGIGALGADAVYLPEGQGIRKLDAGTGRELAFLRWPPGTATKGNLLLLDDALVACSPTRLAICPTPEASLAAADADVQREAAAYGPLLARATLRAWNGDAADAAQDVERALGIAQASGDRGALLGVRRQAALCLAAATVETGQSNLLARASELAPDEPAVQSELALAKLRWALQQPKGRDAAAAYLSLCRAAGMVERPTDWAIASLWTELAQAVRQQCAARPAAAEEWHAGLQALTEQAAARADAETLADIASYAPHREERAAALLHLGSAWEAAGQPDLARLAFAQVVIAEPPSAAGATAAEGLKRALAAAGKGAGAAAYVAALSSGGPACELGNVPTGQAAWSMPGLLVPPAGPVAGSLQGKALVLRGERLACVDAANGTVAWTAQLPAGLPADAATRRELTARAGPGYPAYALGFPAVVVGLQGVLLGLEPTKGTVEWQAELPAQRAPWVVEASIPRLDIIRRARRGLPVPAPGALRRRFSSGGLFTDALVAGSVDAAGRIAATDPFTGRLVLDRLPQGRTQGRGALAAASGGRLCVAYQDPPSLLVFDANGRLLARWRFPDPTPIGALVAGDGNAAIADYQSVLRLDLHEMRLAAVRPILDGVDALLCADASLAVVRTMAGGTVAVEMGSGTRQFDLSRPGEAQAVWAARRGDVLYLLEAPSLGEAVPYGPIRFYTGAGLAMRAVALPSAETLWRYELPNGHDHTVSTPASCGDLWLLSASREDQIRLIGVDSLTGREAFAAEQHGEGDPGPVPFVVSAGRVLVEAKGTVSALAPSELSIRDAVARARAAR